MTSRIRIAKFLAQAAVGSRRSCEKYIESGRVRVNGEIVPSPAFLVDPESDRVEFDGHPLTLQKQKPTLMLHKPPGLLTTCSDPHGRPTVFDCLPAEIVRLRLFPVGRLDKRTEGLLLLTTDGELAYRLMHPRFGVEKTYRVWAKGLVKPETLARLEQGVLLHDGETAPAKARFLRSEGRLSVVDITIHEGRKRQVRRMFSKVGHQVDRLVRLALGPLSLGELKPGEWRFLSEGEMKELLKATTQGEGERQDSE